MRMSSISALVLVIIGVCVAVTADTIDGPSAKRIPVDLWSVGDDGLSQRLREAVENAFKSSPDFALSSGEKPGTLVVTIPTNVD